MYKLLVNIKFWSVLISLFLFGLMFLFGPEDSDEGRIDYKITDEVLEMYEMNSMDTTNNNLDTTMIISITNKNDKSLNKLPKHLKKL